MKVTLKKELKPEQEFVVGDVVSLSNGITTKFYLVQRHFLPGGRAEYSLHNLNGESSVTGTHETVSGLRMAVRAYVNKHNKEITIYPKTKFQLNLERIEEA
ncbi:hypothetical protein AB3N02_22735 [Priestia aryabhattai]|uniref:hypothetical protein n=1 Tax=Priestia aryabhattai TaxID=412384 RepID=UPI0039A0F596